MLALTPVTQKCVARSPLSVMFPRRATHPLCSTSNTARMPLDVQRKSLRRPPHQLWLCPQWLLHVSPPIITDRQLHSGQIMAVAGVR
jgi:hypothetical protein